MACWTFFDLFFNYLFGMVVVVCDQVHDEETIFRNSSFWLSFFLLDDSVAHLGIFFIYIFIHH